MTSCEFGSPQRIRPSAVIGSPKFPSRRLLGHAVAKRLARELDADPARVPHSGAYADVRVSAPTDTSPALRHERSDVFLFGSATTRLPLCGSRRRPRRLRPRRLGGAIAIPFMAGQLEAHRRARRRSAAAGAASSRRQPDERFVLPHLPEGRDPAVVEPSYPQNAPASVAGGDSGPAATVRASETVDEVALSPTTDRRVRSRDLLTAEERL